MKPLKLNVDRWAPPSPATIPDLVFRISKVRA